MVPLCFQTATAQPRQPHRVDCVKQTDLKFRKGMQQGRNEHVTCDAPYRV
jgi:hypothetical protein